MPQQIPDLSRDQTCQITAAAVHRLAKNTIAIHFAIFTTRLKECPSSYAEFFQHRLSGFGVGQL